MAGGELFGSSFSKTSFTRSVRTVLLLSDETGGLAGIVLLLFLIFNGVCSSGGGGSRVQVRLNSDLCMYLSMINFATSSVCGFSGN